MYNITPHGTTGKSPSKLLFNRRIRDKIPSIADIIGEEIDQEARSVDITRKQKGKEREDMTRQSKEMVVKVGDKVVVQKMIPCNKLTSRFRDAEYTITQRNGNEVVLVGEGKTIRRHISHVKPIPIITEENPLNNEAPSSGTSTASEKKEENEEVDQEPRSVISPGPSTAESDEPAEQAPGGRVSPLKLKKRDGMWKRATDE